MGAALTKVVFLGFFLGSILGSFSLVLAERSLTNKSFWGRSYCPHCKKKLGFFDLFPIISYLLLKGRCRYCKKEIGSRYLLVEVVMGLLVGFLFWQTFEGLKFPLPGFEVYLLIFDLVLKTFFITILSSLFITDLKEMLIPDRVILPSILVGFVLGLIFTLSKIYYLFDSLKSDTLGKYLLPPYSEYFYRHALVLASPFLSGILMGFLIGGFFWLLILITRGKGMGGGDVKLGAFMGLMLGFPQALVALMLSFLTGAVFALILVFLGKKSFKQAIPFGPFLVLGSLISLFFGNQILDWYLKLGY